MNIEFTHYTNCESNHRVNFFFTKNGNCIFHICHLTKFRLKMLPCKVGLSFKSANNVCSRWNIFSTMLCIFPFPFASNACLSPLWGTGINLFYYPPPPTYHNDDGSWDFCQLVYLVLISLSISSHIVFAAALT